VECDALDHGIGVVCKKKVPFILKETNLKEKTYSNQFMKKKKWTYYMQLRNDSLS
jgi:hypothetical protein